MNWKGIKLVVTSNLGKLSSSEAVEVVNSLTNITGQKAVITKAKKSISNFSIRKGMINGSKVTLRAERATNFLKKVVLFVLPSDSTFKGLKESCICGRVLNFGIRNIHTFPEVIESNVLKGLNLVLVCSSSEELRNVIEFCKIPFA